MQEVKQKRCDHMNKQLPGTGVIKANTKVGGKLNAQNLIIELSRSNCDKMTHSYSRTILLRSRNVFVSFRLFQRHC